MAFTRTRLFLLALLLAPLALSAQDQPQPLRVAIVGLEHGHVDGFLHALPAHHDVQLVGVADADASLLARYQQKFSLPETILYKSEAHMIERAHPQAVLVYTPIGEHRHAIGIAAQYGVSSMVEKPLTISLDDALAIREIARTHAQSPRPRELRDHLVRKQQGRL
ncbi:MAG TPA: Gfo/Idh/MocA family oxidoreductase [Terracidiphilus sp.]|nr:Gfo/Idh/MocA family oxidoreductase [Terracidiphilus sp.]